MGKKGITKTYVYDFAEDMPSLLRAADGIICKAGGLIVSEALACGLPTLYYDSGGHPELVGYGGLPFARPDEIPDLLERLREHHETYRRVIAPTSIVDVCRCYMELIFGDAPYAA